MTTKVEVSIDTNDAQNIIDKNFPESQAKVVKITELRNHGFSHTLNSKTYLMDIRKPGNEEPPLRSCFITISTTTSMGAYQNSLPLAAELLARIRSQTDIPILASTLDTSLALIPYHYLLSPLSPFQSGDIISLPDARRSGALTLKDSLMIDLMLGKFLGQLHNGVQNDWYGLPELGGKEPSEPSYSWQETFTSLFEALLAQVEASGYDLPYADTRLYLSRAIGSFLFDDVEVPSLVWFTGSEDDIYLAIPAPDVGSEIPRGIAAILPNIAHALWGDPLLECFMMGSTEEGPTAAFLEGYIGGGGSPLLVFARQRTKRMWYTVFLSLLVLTKYGVNASEGDDEEQFIKEKRDWAKEALKKYIEALKDAPCY